MYVIGLTGGIASGKSTAAQTLRALGAQVIDADAISRAVTAPGGAAEAAILDRFGTLDRRRLGDIVFADASARQDLNAIVHPLVQREMIAEMAVSMAPVVVLDVPLLYESGMEGMADEVWVVHVPQEEQVRRAMERDGLTREDALARIHSQMPTEEKLRRADAAIDTSGSFAQTQAQIEDLWQRALDTATHAKAAYPTPAAQTHTQRRHRSQQRREEQRSLEADASAAPKLPHSRPFEPKKSGAWEDTSTLLEIPEQRTFFARQPALFWVVAALLLLALLSVIGVIGVNAWRAEQARQAEERRLQLLAEEKARYKFDYRDIIEANAAAQGVDPALVAAVIYNESRFDPMAESRLGARGLMQVMSDTGDWIAYRLDELDTYTFDQMYDPQKNIQYGTWFLGYLSRMFDGDPVKIAAGYHAGQYAVLGWLENPEHSADGVTLDSIPYPGTEQYVQRVVNAYEIYIKHYYTPEDQAQAV